MEFEKDPEGAKERNMKLPGLSEYTPEQMFYISYAQRLCSNMKIFYDENMHSPDEFRANGVLTNDKNFAKVFNCPINSPMNPKTKCELW